MAVVVFDLDMTIIDSSHRHVSKPCGAIDLARWFENATPEKIAKDTLLPLASAVRRMYDAGHHIIFCTARTMRKADFDFLSRYENELPHHICFGRPIDAPDGENVSDGEIKIIQIREYIETLGFRDFDHANVIIFEDNLKTIAAFQREGAIGIDAVRANTKLRKVA